MSSAKKMEPKRLVVVSNRLPVIAEKDQSGRWKGGAGMGGLVTALSPVLRDRGGMWIGWLGIEGPGPKKIEELLQESGKEVGYRLHPVELTRKEIRGFY